MLEVLAPKLVLNWLALIRSQSTSFDLIGGGLEVFLFISCPFYLFLYKRLWGASLVAQWLRICLLMQATRVRALVWEDPTCRGATRPVSHNY